MRERLEASGELAQATMQEPFPDSIWLEADKNGRFLWAHSVGVSPVVTSPGLVGRSEEFPMLIGLGTDRT
jgi:hypothetical protein